MCSKTHIGSDKARKMINPQLGGISRRGLNIQGFPNLAPNCQRVTYGCGRGTWIWKTAVHQSQTTPIQEAFLKKNKTCYLRRFLWLPLLCFGSKWCCSWRLCYCNELDNTSQTAHLRVVALRVTCNRTITVCSIYRLHEFHHKWASQSFKSTSSTYIYTSNWRFQLTQHPLGLHKTGLPWKDGWRFCHKKIISVFWMMPLPLRRRFYRVWQNKVVP